MSTSDLVMLCLGCAWLGFVLGAGTLAVFTISAADKWLRSAAKPRDGETEIVL